MKSLSPHTLKLHDQVSLTYGVVLPHDIVLNDILNPKYWEHHSNKLRPGDKIEIRTEGSMFYAELFVVDVGHLAAKMKVLSAIALQNTKESEDAIKIEKDAEQQTLEDNPGYSVKWVSPTKKWGVKREGQKDWVRTGFETKDAAQLWIKGDQRAMAA